MNHQPSLSLEEFAKLQIPALRHDADRLEAWRGGRADDLVVRSAAERLLRVHATIEAQDWFEIPISVSDGLQLIRQAIEQDARATAYAGLTTLLVRVTREYLRDDPGPLLDGGPLAAQMALGIKKK